MSSELYKEFVRLSLPLQEIEESMDDSDAEPICERMLQILYSDPKNRDLYETFFLRLIENNIPIPATFEFFMYELKWPKVKSTLEEKIRAQTSTRARFYFESILRCFSDNWSGARSYRRWSDDWPETN